MEKASQSSMEIKELGAETLLQKKESAISDARKSLEEYKKACEEHEDSGFYSLSYEAEYNQAIALLAGAGDPEAIKSFDNLVSGDQGLKYKTKRQLSFLIRLMKDAGKPDRVQPLIERVGNSEDRERFKKELSSTEAETPWWFSLGNKEASSMDKAAQITDPYDRAVAYIKLAAMGNKEGISLAMAAAKEIEHGETRAFVYGSIARLGQPEALELALDSLDHVHPPLEPGQDKYDNAHDAIGTSYLGLLHSALSVNELSFAEKIPEKMHDDGRRAVAYSLIAAKLASLEPQN